MDSFFHLFSPCRSGLGTDRLICHKQLVLISLLTGTGKPFSYLRRNFLTYSSSQEIPDWFWFPPFFRAEIPLYRRYSSMSALCATARYAADGSHPPEALRAWYRNG